jgi:hypothetical protein
MKNLLLLLLTLVAIAPAWGENAAPLSLGVVIELKGPTEGVSDLVAKLKNAPVYKAAACETANKSEATVRIDCAKADSGLMVFLSKNAPPTVQWSISAAEGSRPCPGTPGCQVMHCPPPNGPLMCCHSTSPYGAC